jgi:hypothetical protein
MRIQQGDASMNSLMTEVGDILRSTQDLRNQLLSGLTDADLRFSLPGNPTLGELIREDAETERIYADAFKTFRQAFEYGTSDPALATSVDKLRAYFQAIDADMAAALEAFSEDDIKTRTIDRGWATPLRMNLDFYVQAVLIFFGKATIYFRAASKPLPEQWQAWIG